MAVQASSGVNSVYPAVQQYQRQVQQPQEGTDAATASQATAQAPVVPSVQPTEAASSDQVKFSSSVTVKNLDTVRAIEQMHARMNQLVKGARETNEQLNKVAEQLSTMQGNLNTIVKNFPPFPIDSKERQELLMSYTALRQEMMRMTVPHPPPPLYEQVKHLWDSTMGQNGQMLASAVPPLDTGSSDAQVQQTAGQLEKTGAQIADLSSGVTKALIGG